MSDTAGIPEATGTPVEISTYFPPDEWTDASLAELARSYALQLEQMGASPEEIRIDTQHNDNGSAELRALWDRTGTRSFTDFAPAGEPVVGDATVAGAGAAAGSTLQGETTEGAQGAGAVFGEADRSSQNHGDRSAPLQATLTPELLNADITTDDDGNTHVTA
jgi:hypothetical protein